MILGQFLGGGLGQSPNGELRGGIRAEQLDSFMTGDGTGVDDRAAALSPHDRRHRFNTEENAVHVDSEDLFEVFLAGFFNEPNLGNTGIVDQDIDGFEMIFSRGNQMLKGFFIRHIGDYRDAVHIQVLDFCSRGGRSFFVQISDHNVEAVLSEL